MTHSRTGNTRKAGKLLASVFVCFLMTLFSTAYAQVVECNALPVWDAGTAYNGGAQVQHENAAYAANWWTQGDNPAQNSGQWQVWTKKGDCSVIVDDKPNVAITAPTAGASFNEGDNVAITADATIVTGSIAKVEFFNGATKLGEDLTAPYEVVVTNAAAGTYNATAIATSAAGLSTTSAAVSFNVIGLVTPPSVSLVNIPAEGKVGTAITLEATATDADGVVEKVEFFAGTTKIGEALAAPFSITWTPTAAAVYSITAKATDNDAATTTSAAATINVINDVPPTGCDGVPAYVEGTAYNVGDVVKAADNAGLFSKYSCKISGWCSSNSGWAYAPGTGSNWQDAWDLVEACPVDALPEVSVALSSSIIYAGTNVTITANATDNSGIAKVEFFQNGIRLGEATVAPYTYTWNAVAAGEYQITAVATDDKGQTATSTAVTLISSADKVVVNITAPTKSTFTTGEVVTIAADASSIDGQIGAVSFYLGTQRLGTATIAPYTVQWNVPLEGQYTIKVEATDVKGNKATATKAVQVMGPVDKILVGYWHNFDNGSGFIKMKDVSANWDVINVSFAEPKRFNAEEGVMEFIPDPKHTTEAEFLAGVQYQQSLGKKVLISIGGANGHTRLESELARQNFVRTMIEIIERYGFDGFDLDLEGASLSLDAGDLDFKNPTTPAIVNMISATKEIDKHFGGQMILSMAPETYYVQVAYTNYGGAAGAYIPVIHGLRNELDWIHVQHYNGSSLTGLDGNMYAQGTADFHVAMSEMLIQGFPVAGNQAHFFPGLRPDQVAFGIPSSPEAAGSGQTPIDVTQKALDYLIKGISYGGKYKLMQPGGYPEFRGLMTWSINWDASHGNPFSNAHRAYFNAVK